MSAKQRSSQILEPAAAPKTSGKGRVANKDKVRVGQRRVTPKQAIMIRGIVAGKSGTQAVLDAYNTEDRDVARSMAAENLAKPSVQVALQEAFERKGLTIDSAVGVINDALRANKTTQGTLFEKGTDGTVRARNTLIETDLADHGIRLNAAKIALHLMGADNDPDGNRGGNTFNFKGDAKVFIKAEQQSA